MRVSDAASEPRVGYAQKLPEYLSMASQFVGLAQGVVKTAQVLSPYLRTGLALAAAV